MRKLKGIVIDADPILFEVCEGKYIKTNTFANEVVDLEPFKVRFRQLVTDICDEALLEVFGKYKVGKKVKICLTDPNKNFRYSLLPSYKCGRKESDRSDTFYRLREWANLEYGSTSWISRYKTAEEYSYIIFKNRSKAPIKQLDDLYQNMIKRCYRKDSKADTYKDNGIKVYSDWVSSKPKFVKWAIKHGYAVGLEMDRVDNSVGYIPSNIQFISSTMNKTKQNLCDSGDRYITFDMKKKAFDMLKHGATWRTVCKTLDIRYGNGSSSKQSKIQMRLQKSLSKSKWQFTGEFETELELIESKLDDDVRFMHKNEERIMVRRASKPFLKFASWEPDDEVAYYVRKGWYGCSMDKDILKTTAGVHFDTYHSRRGMLETSQLEADRFKMLQTLMGDPTDDIPALPKVKGTGMIPIPNLPKGTRQPFKFTEKLAIAALDKNGWTDEGVLKTFTDLGFGEKERTLNRRLIGLDQWHPKKGITLWKP